MKEQTAEPQTRRLLCLLARERRLTVALRIVAGFVGALAISPTFAENAGTPAATDDTKTLALTVAKFNAYVSYMNYTAGAVAALQRYEGWVKAKTGPTGRERNIDGIDTASNGGSSRTAALQAVDTDPVLPELDSAVRAYASADDAAVTVINEAHGYYAHLHGRLARARGPVTD